jgi:hypothetical protein
MSKYTLFVIFGPFAAEAVCPRKRKVAVRMSINDTMRFLKLAMVKIIDSARSKQRPALVGEEGCEDGIGGSERIECPGLA